MRSGVNFGFGSSSLTWTIRNFVRNFDSQPAAANAQQKIKKPASTDAHLVMPPIREGG
jgi:hypothetical protein